MHCGMFKSLQACEEKDFLLLENSSTTTKPLQPTYFMRVILLYPANKQGMVVMVVVVGGATPDCSVKLLKLWIQHPYWALISVWQCMPKSKRCSALSRLAPGSLLKKCGALNLPNYCCFHCEGKSKAENYTCRWKTTQRGLTARRKRKTGRQTGRDRLEGDRIMTALNYTLQRERKREIEFLGMVVECHLLLNEVQRHPWHQFGTLLHTKPGERADREKIRVRNNTSSQTRQSPPPPQKKKELGVHSTNYMTRERDNEQIKPSKKKQKLQRLQQLSHLMSVFWLSDSQRGGGRQRDTQSHISEMSGMGVIVYCAWLAPTGRASCKSQRVVTQSVTDAQHCAEPTASHHTPGGEQECVRMHVCVYFCVSVTHYLQRTLNTERDKANRLHIQQDTKHHQDLSESCS